MSRPMKRPTALDSNPLMMSSNHHLGSYSVLPAPNKKNDTAAVDQATGASSEPPYKRLRFAEDAVTVIVGSEKVSFTVHQRLLCDASRFFKDALSEGFKEATEKQVRLPDVAPTSFESFLSWLYCSFLAQTHATEGLKTNVSPFSWAWTLKLYKLAQYLQCPAFGNNVIACIRARFCNNLLVPMPTAQEITEVYSQTLGDCGLRRFIVLMHTTKVGGEGLLSTEERIREWTKDVPAEFATDLIVRFMLDDSGWLTGFWAQDWVVEWVKDDEAGYQVENKGLSKTTTQ